MAIKPLPAIEADSLAARTVNKVAAEMGEETVILDIDSGYYFQLNKTGARIWGLLETPMTLEALCTNVQSAFEVDPATCRLEVLAFLELMRDKGLVQIGSAEATRPQG
jgi:hypothetical protein